MSHFVELSDEKLPTEICRKTLEVEISRNKSPCTCLIKHWRFCFGVGMMVGVIFLLLNWTGMISLNPPHCSGPIQENLLYGCSSSRSLASRICCHNTRFAEPAGFQNQPGIQLFSKLNRSRETVFYDSVCGIPLFVAPRGRSFAEWEAESQHHGWPSFRQEEIVSENIEIFAGGEVRSTCGVHLGHRFSDSAGSRYCIDLVCIAGHSNSTTVGI